MISEKSDGAINNRSPLQPRSINNATAATSKWYDADTNGRAAPRSAATSDDDVPPADSNGRNNGQHRRNGDSDADDQEDADMAPPANGNGVGVLDGSTLSPPTQHGGDVSVSDKVFGRDCWCARVCVRTHVSGIPLESVGYTLDRFRVPCVCDC